ncbi:16S rRNA (guanine(966)-N(2))-methyltransferase RsmD [Sulfurospirillum sp. 1612]|uniref:16S rRNA (guanine(966)-N(2))-methyltransferase RsmD n=1 Tax=Sulfurospirillum sp. 1612 TaxID=3094835 RepID=UPI002F9409BD
MKNKEIYTTIRAGLYKGKKIKIPAIGTTRSTKSILKGSFFDTIQFEIRDQIFVEVFGGSGSMGLEALSMGAKKAYFIEKNATAFEILRFNCSQIDKNHAICKKADSFEYFETLLGEIDSKSFFYFDPPFSIRDGMEDVYEKVYQLIQKIPPAKAALITIEHMSALKMPEHIASFTLQKTKKFGKSSLSYYR